jgi:preprotein translocase subunit YajC
LGLGHKASFLPQARFVIENQANPSILLIFGITLRIWFFFNITPLKMLYVLLQAAGGGNTWPAQLLFFGGIILVFYFFMIRPQQKKQKDQKTFVDSLKVGDKVVTVGGLHGKVAAFEDKLIVVEADKGVRLRFEKTSISYDNSKLANESSKTAQ